MKRVDTGSVDSFKERLRYSRTLLGEGNYRQAFEAIVDEPVSNTRELFQKIETLIDVGFLLRDEKILMYGVYLCKENLSDLLSLWPSEDQVYRNLGNQCVNIVALRRFQKGEAGDDSELAEAVCFYRKALSLHRLSPEKEASLRYRLGVALRGEGRTFEALTEFHKARNLMPKGREIFEASTALIEQLAFLVPRSRDHLLREIYDLIEEKRGERKEDNSTTAKELRKRQERIRKTLGEEVFKDPLIPPSGSVEVETDWEYHVLSTCVKEGLYLNPCGFFRKDNRAVGDDAEVSFFDARLCGKKSKAYDRICYRYNRLVEHYLASRYTLLTALFQKTLPHARESQPLKISEFRSLGLADALLWQALEAAKKIFREITSLLEKSPERVGSRSLFSPSSNLCLRALVFHADEKLRSCAFLCGKVEKEEDFLALPDKEKHLLQFFRYIKEQLLYLLQALAWNNSDTTALLGHLPLCAFETP